MRLITHAAWGAQHGKGPTNVTPSGGVAVHYVGAGRLATVPHSKCAARVRAVEDQHVNGNGWAAIAYSYLACHHGYVFEGRGLGHRTAAQGTNSGNQYWLAVCALVGDGDTQLPDELLSAVRDAIDYMRGHGAGRGIRGHRYFHSTSCPGAPLYAWVDRGAPRPSSTPTPTPEPVEETLKTLVDLGAKQPQTIPAGQRRSLEFEVEYLDEDKVHTDAKDGARYPSIFPKGGDAPYGVTVQLVLADPPADGVMVSLASYERDGNDWVRDVRFEDVLAARHIMHANLRMNSGLKYRADVLNESAADVVVAEAYVLIAN